jgi:single-strand DNA-binding protein
MSKDLNKVQLTGNLGKDPETRSTAQGSALTRFSVASSRRWRTAEGDDRDETEWFTVVAWNKLGELCAQYLQKGARVYIEGRLQTRSWEDQQTGQKRYMTEVIANDLLMLDARRERLADVPGEDGGAAGVPEPTPELAPARGASPERAPQSQQSQTRSPDTAHGGGFGSGEPVRPAPRLALAEAPSLKGFHLRN